MRIGILTFHEIYNPGAYLQAYATLMTLRGMGHEAHVINYTSPGHRFRPWRTLLQCPHGVLLNPRRWSDSIRRNAAFAAVQSYLRPTRRCVTHADLAHEEFDAVVVGADIVWNYQNPQWGDDPVYFGEHLNCRRLVAYAPSCGPLDLDSPIPTFVTSGLRKFHAISVRDYHTARMVYKAASLDVPIVMDPTFDLDLSPIRGAATGRRPYLFVYAMPRLLSVEAVTQVLEFARKRGLRLVAACYRHSWVDRNVIDANPFDWVSLVRDAQYVLTNSFHGTIIAIKLKKQFVTESNWAIASKVSPVLEKLDLENRLLSPERDLGSILDAPYYRDNVAHAVDQLAAEAKTFLGKALSD